MTTKITPTVGRVLWYWRRRYDGFCGDPAQPFAASVAFVHVDGLVNLSVVDHDGQQFHASHIEILNPETDPVPDDGGWAQWMPYQLGQAKKDGAA